MRKMISIMLVVGIAVSIMGCQKNSKADDKAATDLTMTKGTLTVGMNLQVKPMEYLNEEQAKPEGFDVELAKLLGETLGLKVEIVDTTSENLLPSLDAKIYDCVISTLEATKEVTDHYQVTRSYADITSVADKIEPKGATGELTIALKESNKPLMICIDETLKTLLENGKVAELSQKYFETDITLEK